MVDGSQLLCDRTKMRPEFVGQMSENSVDTSTKLKGQTLDPISVSLTNA